MSGCFFSETRCTFTNLSFAHKTSLFRQFLEIFRGNISKTFDKIKRETVVEISASSHDLLGCIREV